MAAFEQFPRDSLHQIKRYPGNHRCCDCPSQDTNWASVSHGTLICLECAGKHRSLGVQVSFVRSITMDSWSKQQVEMMKQGGNGQMQRYFEKMVARDKSISEIYCSGAADSYRQQLSEKVKKIISPEVEVCVKVTPKLRSTPTASPPSSSSSTTKPSCGSSSTFSASFGEGTMGMTLTKDHADLAVVSKVVPDSQAERLGVMVGDFVVGVKEKTIQNYDFVMHQISFSPRPIMIRFGRLNTPPKPLHHLLQPSRSEPMLSDYIEPSLNFEYHEQNHMSLKFSPKLYASDSLSPYSLSTLSSKGRHTFDDLHGLDELIQTCKFDNTNDEGLVKKQSSDASMKMQVSPDEDTLKLSEESMKLSHDSHSQSMQSIQLKTQVKILDSIFAWCDGTITRIHRNNTFQVVYTNTGTIEKYVEATRIALLPDCVYDPKVAKRITNIYDTSRGTGIFRNETTFSNLSAERSNTSSPLPLSNYEGSVPSSEETNTITSSSKYKSIQLLESPLGFSLGKGLQGEAIVIKIIPNSVIDTQHIVIGDVLYQINDQCITDYDEAMNLLLTCDYPLTLCFRPASSRSSKREVTNTNKGFYSEPSSPNRLFQQEGSPPLSTYLSQRSSYTSATATITSQLAASTVDEFSITINQVDLGFEVKQEMRDGNEILIVSSLRDNSQVRKCGVRIGYAVVAINKQYLTTHALMMHALLSSKRPLSITFRKVSLG